ncbi:MAG: VWA domain-containing protein, partial [Gammaproteobacteria bacterium]|nr:VWA domain-containing protein [Gammaproteobacteria bacterium]
VPFLKQLPETSSAGRYQQRHSWPMWLAILGWCLLVLSAMRPQWLGELIEIPVTGRDLMLAVDLSESMQQDDFVIQGQRVDRLSATKWVAGDFIERRTGDRIGLILFGERAYLQAPLTFDRKTVKTLLYEAAIGLAGRSTAIGDAIGLAVKRLRKNENSDRVLLLLTDGANTAGNVFPKEAAELAAQEGLKIYTIGMGADEMFLQNLFGFRSYNPSRDLDEETLKEIARITGGRYFRARDTAELEKIYALLDELEPVEKDMQQFRPRTALYFWPLAMAMMIGLVMVILRFRGRW